MAIKRRVFKGDENIDNDLMFSNLTNRATMNTAPVARFITTLHIAHGDLRDCKRILNQVESEVCIQ